MRSQRAAWICSSCGLRGGRLFAALGLTTRDAPMIITSGSDADSSSGSGIDTGTGAGAGAGVGHAFVLHACEDAPVQAAPPS